MTNDHRWNTEEYEARTRQLYRTELHKLYPSEAWALYRILPNCKSILDLGCGNGAMAAIAKQIAPDAKYTGMDHQANLMEEAKKAFPFAEFDRRRPIAVFEELGCSDCVMSWSVIKSFGNWREVVSEMVAKANKYVICDIRVANTDIEAFDDQVLWADYGGRRGPITFLNYQTFRDGLLENAKDLKCIELAAYQSEWGQFVHLKEGLSPETFLVVAVLHKKGSNADPNDECEVFERLPGNLKR